MSTTGHETEAINVQGLKASLKKGGNKGIFNEAICSTAGATAAKVTNTTPPSFSLVSGAKIIVKFTYTISVANATLQVGSTAAKPIYLKGAALAANVVKAGTSLLLAYDGTAFNIIGGIGGNETDISYDTTNKKLTKTIDDVQSDVVTASTIVEDGGGIEVEIGDTAPVGDVKLFVDEDADPAVTLDVYTRQETDTFLAAKADKSTTYTKTEVDNKIATAPEQSTINATDYVVLKDTDGVNCKISKANIMGVVKDALAELLLNNDLGTSFTNVPALGTNVFGSATLANLASVLSEDWLFPYNPFNSQTDIKTLAENTSNGISYFRVGHKDYLVFKNGTGAITIYNVNDYTSVFKPSYCHRHNTTWGEWIDL